jgi:hypothetical protein
MALDNPIASRDHPPHAMNGAPTIPIWQVVPWWPVILLAGAALAFYVASRLGAFALDHLGTNPAGAAAAHWLPIAVVTIVILKHYPHAAVSVIFASSVACLTLVPGVTLLAAPRGAGDEPLAVEPIELNERRAWSMVLPAALIAMLAGFRGYFTMLHAALLIAQGLVTLLVWTTPTTPTDHSPTQERQSTHVPGSTAIVVIIVFWIGLTLFGALMANSGVGDIARRLPHVTTGLTGALMLAPALVLPMIGFALSLAPRGRSGSVISTSVDCVLLNLCVLLPIAIIARRVLNGPDLPLPYPMASWRIDSVILVVFGAALLVTSTKRWIPGRAEGFIGVLAFAAYMIANKSLAMK